MAYVLLMIEEPGQRATRSDDEGRAVFARMERFADDLREQGLLLGVQSLRSQRSATRVQVRVGRAQLLDGPFAEAKEMVGGFFIVDCASREQALELAVRCPAAEWLTVEVRELGACYDA